MVNIIGAAFLSMCSFFSVSCAIACNASLHHSLARVQADTSRALKAIDAHNFSKEQEEACVDVLQKNINKLEMMNDTNGKIEGEIALLEDYISLLRELRAYCKAPSEEQADRLRKLGDTDSTIKPIVEQFVTQKH